MNNHDLLLELFNSALGAAMPDGKFGPYLPPRPRGRTIVLGAGKASARMARAFEQEWAAPLEGLVVTRYGHACPTQYIEIVEAAHPVPDEKGRATAARILDIARSAGPDDLVIFLMSGGASSLLSLPAAGLNFEEKQKINRELLKSGMPIGAMNTVRKSLSAIKGGRLAAAASRAQLMTFLISDVPGDDVANARFGGGAAIDAGLHPARRRLARPDKCARTVGGVDRDIDRHGTKGPLNGIIRLLKEFPQPSPLVRGISTNPHQQDG